MSQREQVAPRGIFGSFSLLSLHSPGFTSSLSRLKSSQSMATIAPATAEDCLQLAEIQFDAFEPSIIHQRIFGNVSKENHSKHLAERFKKAIEKQGSEVFKAVIKNEEGKEKIVGLAFWDRPKVKGQKDEEEKEDEGKTEEEKRAAMENRFPEGTDYDLAISYFGRLDPKVDEPFYRESSLTPCDPHPSAS